MLSSLVTKEMQFETVMRHHFWSVKLVKMKEKKVTIPIVGVYALK